tara:strand:+ start:1057 stop:1410 length:354 start_codon:yes stop_codon:yes gene_type:complete
MMIKQAAFVNIDFDNNEDNESEAIKSRVDIRLGLSDLSTFYTFKAWAKESLSIYKDGIGTYSDIDDYSMNKHSIIFLNYIKNNFSEFDNGTIDREEWTRKLSSALRYGKKLIRLKDG